jgi:redox-sensitive bicupin YhaK (pirin superfamily)
MLIRLAWLNATIPVRRPFPGRLSFSDTDPSLLLDNVGSLINAPEQAKGVTWHPHRAVKTVSYVLDNEIAHHETTAASSKRAIHSG